jgi:hypothetical protein
MASMESGSVVDTFPAGGKIFNTVLTDEEIDMEDEEPNPGRFGREAGSLVSQDLGTNKAINRNQE